MQFPVYINLGIIQLHPHLFFETLAYFIGFRLYLFLRRKERLPMMKTMWVVVGAALGAAIGSKILFLFEDPYRTLQEWNQPAYLMGGKTIVGGLLGGLIGVELTKKKIGVTASTGDDMVFPLIVGMSIGRIGCFLTGLPDHTYGNPTTWWTGVDFGDGVLRHPTQLYEIAFLLLFGTLLFWLHRIVQLPDGGLFQLFMFGYLIWRFGIDFLKPTPQPFFGLNNIQVAALMGIIYYSWKITRCNLQNLGKIVAKSNS